MIEVSMKRTLTADTVKKIGEEVRLSGWIHARRDHGKIMFIDLRDRSGIVQVVSHKDKGNVGVEDVVEIVGLVKKRPEKMVNPRLATGTVEIEATSITILSQAKELPIPIDTDGLDINEDIRLKYRYVDLRRPRLQRILRLRSKFVDVVRQYLFANDFIEI
jgi:aspartyl-tRNA synthetase